MDEFLPHEMKPWEAMVFGSYRGNIISDFFLGWCRSSSIHSLRSGGWFASDFLLKPSKAASLPHPWYHLGLSARFVWRVQALLAASFGRKVPEICF